MKTRFFRIATLALGAMLLLASCNKDNDNKSVQIDALVTVKEDASGNCFLQVDDNTTVIPTNMTTNPYGKEVRALTILELESNADIKDGDKVNVVWADSVLTKKLVPAVENSAEVYGDDPIEVYRGWLTVAEDGYVTINFATYRGIDPNAVHWINLVKGENPDNPNELVLRHKIDCDMVPNMFNGVVAFNVREILPDTDENVQLTIRYESFTGQKSFTLTANGNK